MGLLFTTIAGLVVWIVLWAIGVKPFDAFMITVTMITIAATARLVAPAFSAHRGENEPETRWDPR